MARARLSKPVVSRSPEWVLTVTLPIVVRSISNLHESPFVRHKRAKGERIGTLAALRTLIGTGPHSIPIGYALTVHMTRLGGRKLDDDNLDGAFKSVRDGVADWFGIDDGDPIWRWDCFQSPGGDAGIEITIRCAPDDRPSSP